MTYKNKLADVESTIPSQGKNIIFLNIIKTY